MHSLLFKIHYKLKIMFLYRKYQFFTKLLLLSHKKHLFRLANCLILSIFPHFWPLNMYLTLSWLLLLRYMSWSMFDNSNTTFILKIVYFLVKITVCATIVAFFWWIIRLYRVNERPNIFMNVTLKKTPCQYTPK